MEGFYQIRSEKSRLFSSISMRGSIAEFLRLHLPSKCNIALGGEIVSATSTKLNRSGQIDVIIYNESAIQGALIKKWSFLEDTICVVSVKSSLAKKELLDAIDNLDSVPNLPADNVIIQPGHTNYRPDLLPLRLIFAYEGPKIDKTILHLREFVGAGCYGPMRIPHFIVVNGSYLIEIVSQDNPPRHEISYSISNDNKSSGGGWYLMRLIWKLQEAVKASSFFYSKMERYLPILAPDYLLETAASDCFSDALNGRIKMVKDYLKAGGQVDSQDSAGNTMLIYAVLGNQIPTVKFLLTKNADKAITNRGGITAFQLAQEKQFAKIEALLQKA